MNTLPSFRTVRIFGHCGLEWVAGVGSLEEIAVDKRRKNSKQVDYVTAKLW
jgi:hypothetical protein